MSKTPEEYFQEQSFSVPGADGGKGGLSAAELTFIRKYMGIEAPDALRKLGLGDKAEELAKKPVPPSADATPFDALMDSLDQVKPQSGAPAADSAELAVPRKIASVLDEAGQTVAPDSSAAGMQVETEAAGHADGPEAAASAPSELELPGGVEAADDAVSPDISIKEEAIDDGGAEMPAASELADEAAASASTVGTAAIEDEPGDGAAAAVDISTVDGSEDAGQGALAAESASLSPLHEEASDADGIQPGELAIEPVALEAVQEPVREEAGSGVLSAVEAEAETDVEPVADDAAAQAVPEAAQAASDEFEVTDSQDTVTAEDAEDQEDDAESELATADGKNGI